MKFFQLIIGATVLSLLASGALADEVDELLNRARTAAAAGKNKEAVDFATQVIKADATRAGAYYLRGREHFRLGKISESVADLDKYVALQPRAEPQQWERGISYYYAKQFKKGASQFELYQTYHDNDVENSVWRYLCVARTEGVEKARKNMLEIKNDTRVAMMHIYDMYRGKLTPDDVLKTANAGEPTKQQLNRRLFYAHLYIGLFHEAAGKEKLARQHITKAAKEHKIGHYMWDVAHVHANRFKETSTDSKE